MHYSLQLVDGIEEIDRSDDNIERSSDENSVLNDFLNFCELDVVYPCTSTITDF